MVAVAACQVVAAHGAPLAQFHSLLKGNLKYVPVYKVAVPLGQHPEVVGDEDARHHIYRVVGPQGHHEEDLAAHGDEGEVAPPVPAHGRELQELYHAHPHVAGVEEVTRLAVRHEDA